MKEKGILFCMQEMYTDLFLVHINIFLKYQKPRLSQGNESANFLEWFENQLLRNLKAPSMIIMDNASYHCTIENKTPDSSWKKKDIQGWLTENNISYEEDMLKIQLLYLVSLNKTEKVYAADQMALQYRHTVLRLIPCHCMFNSIEHIWGISKLYYNKHTQRDGTGEEHCLKIWKGFKHN